MIKITDVIQQLRYEISHIESAVNSIEDPKLKQDANKIKDSTFEVFNNALSKLNTLETQKIDEKTLNKILIFVSKKSKELFSNSLNKINNLVINSSEDNETRKKELIEIEELINQRMNAVSGTSHAKNIENAISSRIANIKDKESIDYITNIIKERIDGVKKVQPKPQSNQVSSNALDEWLNN